jgi:hypothetical protein
VRYACIACPVHAENKGRKSRDRVGKNARGYRKTCILLRENQVLLITFVENKTNAASISRMWI